MAIRRTVRRAPRRKMVWARFAQAGLLSDLQPRLAHDLLDSFRTLNGGAQPIGCTVVRVRLQLSLLTDLAVGGGIVVGLRVGERSESLTGAENDPAQQPHQDWMYWRWCTGVAPGAADNQADTDIVTAYDIDAKAMRKMEELGETLFFHTGLASLTPPADAATYSFRSSVLLKLP